MGQPHMEPEPEPELDSRTARQLGSWTTGLLGHTPQITLALGGVLSIQYN
jgi:hypothetical protein